MKAFKGFNKDMTCRGFQFEEGKTYELPEGEAAKLCESGFHACEMPLDVFSYYPPASSVYREVELESVSDERRDDSKVCASKIKIGAKLDIAGIVKAQIECIKERAHEVEGGHASEKQGAASATGFQGAASATGDWGAASATGARGAASATGSRGAASATGDWGAASATGSQGAASATGSQGAASATGKESVAMACGYQGKAKAAQGCVIFLVERGDWNGETYPILAANAAIVDGERIKAGTWYTLRNGEFVEA